MAAEEKGVIVIGSIAAEYDTYQKSLIACGIADMAKAISEAVKDIKETKDYKASFRLMGIKEDIADFTYSPQLKSKIPADVMTKIDTIKDDLVSGKIDLNKLVSDK